METIGSVRIDPLFDGLGDTDDYEELMRRFDSSSL